MSFTPHDFEPQQPSAIQVNRGNYTELSPFRFWCQKVLPLVYDDSLSYYELLCKVVDYLNKTMEDVETLEGDVTNTVSAFGDLQGYVNSSYSDLVNYVNTSYNDLVTYVNTYFDNLDVQEEINHKLDVMASDGSLTALLAPLVPSLVTAWMNEHITPTSPVIDSSLTISGAGADAKVTGDRLAETNKELNIVKNVDSGNYFTVNTMGGYWDTTNGQYQTYEGNLSCTDKFLVSENEKITVENDFSTTATLFFWDEDGAFIGFKTLYNRTGKTFITPANTKWCAFNYYTSENVDYITVKGETKFQLDVNEIAKNIHSINLFNGNIHTGIHSQTNGAQYGEISDNESYFYTDLIPVDGIEKICALSDFKYTKMLYLTYFNELGRVIGQVNDCFPIINKTAFPAGTKYFIITTNLTEKDTLMIYTKIPSDYISPKSYNINAFNKVDKKYKRLDRGFITGKYPADSPNPIYPLTTGDNVKCSYLIDLTNITKISYLSTGGYYNLKFVDTSKNVISYNVIIEGQTRGTITVPNNVIACVYYTSATTDPETGITFISGEDIPDRIYEYDELIINDGYEKDYLYNKHVVFDGDSITEGAGVSDITIGIAPNNNKGWGYWIQKKHPSAYVYGYAHSGWTVGRISGQTDSLLNHISEYPEDVDIFVLSGGYNDQARQVALGEMIEPTDGSSAYFNATFDQYTFIGALEYWFQQLRYSYPDAVIVYIITPYRVFKNNPVFNNDTKGNPVSGLYTNGKERLDLFWESIRKVCKKWGVKYLDFSVCSNVVGTGESTGNGLTVNSRYFQLNNGVPDFTHPNTKFYKDFLVPQVESLIKSVM